MRLVERYEANDGSIWESAGHALRRDALIAKCQAVEADLGLRPVPENTDFGNGGGYVQQPAGSREKLGAALEDLGATRDSDGPVGRLLHRWMCIDKQDRQWGQPYFALNPDKGQQREIT